jgi:hypothetical protein
VSVDCFRRELPNDRRSSLSKSEILVLDIRNPSLKGGFKVIHAILVHHTRYLSSRYNGIRLTRTVCGRRLFGEGVFAKISSDFLHRDTIWVHEPPHVQTWFGQEKMSRQFEWYTTACPFVPAASS